MQGFPRKSYYGKNSAPPGPIRKNYVPAKKKEQPAPKAKAAKKNVKDAFELEYEAFIAALKAKRDAENKEEN